MLILTGKLRQASDIQTKERKLRKLWIETETPRDNGVADLDLHQFLLEPENCSNEPPAGSPISVSVRAYVAGSNLRFAALGLVSGTHHQNGGENAGKGQKN